MKVVHKNVLVPENGRPVSPSDRKYPWTVLGRPLIAHMKRFGLRRCIVAL